MPLAESCELCSQQAPPQAENALTLSVAIAVADGVGDQQTAAALRQRLGDREPVFPEQNTRIKRIAVGDGVGSQLWRLLAELGIVHHTDCPCLDYAERLNEWGVCGCRLARAEIVEHLAMHAKAYGWGAVATAAVLAVATGLAFRLSVLDPYGSLLDEAIRRAVIAEQDLCAKTAVAKGDAAQ